MKLSSQLNHCCGLDFGTSNSSIGYSLAHEPTLTEFGSKTYLPSAIFFDYDLPKPIFGNEAIERYVDGAEGRMIWSPKNALGTGLISEKTQIKNKGVSFKDIIKLIVKNLKEKCEAQSQFELNSVVCGRPVFFNDDDEELDRGAQNALLEILNSVGFKNVAFEYEPIAAGIHYERTITDEQIALVVDMGGGTSDFTVAKLNSKQSSKNTDRSKNILSVGGIHIAGTDFDRQLSLESLMPEFGLGSKYKSMEGPWLRVPPTLYFDLATWHKIGFVYTKANIAYVQSKIHTSECPQKFERLMHVLRYRYGHHLARLVEKVKIELSDKEKAILQTNEIQPKISLEITRESFEDSVKNHISQISLTIRKTIADAGLLPENIDAIFLTGGSSQIPAVRRSIFAIAPHAQILEGDKFGSVATGLTIAAQEKFR